MTSMKAIQAPVILIIESIIQLGQAMIKITLLLFKDILFLDEFNDFPINFNYLTKLVFKEKL